VRWQQVGGLPCPVARSLSVVGERWTLLILRDCFRGSRRFEQFSASLHLSPHLLSTRLGKLVEEGILEKRAYQEQPVRHEYRLTPKGRDLYPVIATLVRWGDRWMAGPDGPPLTFVHKECGHPMTPEVVCSECRQPIDPRQLELHFREESQS